MKTNKIKLERKKIVIAIIIEFLFGLFFFLIDFLTKGWWGVEYNSSLFFNSWYFYTSRQRKSKKSINGEIKSVIAIIFLVW